MWYASIKKKLNHLPPNLRMNKTGHSKAASKDI